MPPRYWLATVLALASGNLSSSLNQGRSVRFLGVRHDVPVLLGALGKSTVTFAPGGLFELATGSYGSGAARYRDVGRRERRGCEPRRHRENRTPPRDAFALSAARSSNCCAIPARLRRWAIGRVPRCGPATRSAPWYTPTNRFIVACSHDADRFGSDADDGTAES